jgi:hypothetical protein
VSVSGEAGAGYSISKSFKESQSYAFLSYNQTMLQVSIEEWATYVDNSPVNRSGITALSAFDHADPAVVQQYKNFFSNYGSHTVVGCTYGGRFQLTIWASNSNKNTREDFKANLTVAFDGLTSGGSVDTSVKGSNEYKIFASSMQKTCSCQGGDGALAASLSSNPSGTATFDAWVKTAKSNPAIMSMKTVPIWEVLSNSSDPAISSKAQGISDAFTWLTNYPTEIQTKCQFTINSDWAEVDILTPSTTILLDTVLLDGKPYAAKDLTVPITASNTKLSWVNPSHKPIRNLNIEFTISNDGNPIDILMGHGSDSADSPGTGACSLTMHRVCRMFSFSCFYTNFYFRKDILILAEKDLVAGMVNTFMAVL